MCPRLSLTDGVSEDLFEDFGVVVFEGSDVCTGESTTDHQGCVIEFIRDDQASLGDQTWDHCRVCAKTHPKDHGILLPHKLGHETFHFSMNRKGSLFPSWTVDSQRVPVKTLDDSIRALSLWLCKSEIIVWTQIVDREFSPGEPKNVWIQGVLLKSSVVVLWLPFHDRHFCTGNSGNRSIPTISNSIKESSRVEGFEIAGQWRISLKIKIFVRVHSVRKDVHKPLVGAVFQKSLEDVQWRWGRGSRDKSWLQSNMAYSPSPHQLQLVLCGLRPWTGCARVLALPTILPIETESFWEDPLGTSLTWRMESHSWSRLLIH